MLVFEVAPLNTAHSSRVSSKNYRNTNAPSTATLAGQSPQTRGKGEAFVLFVFF